ncbi:lysosomal enzyme receptor protein isoform X2 [Tachypleus tridentatus]|uniref:lysosomal enzyme receptor protein isoform X2 n=1 Tax=Tachypleus tridentatus TaxID=6853 RepID=UPI003FD25549
MKLKIFILTLIACSFILDETCLCLNSSSENCTVGDFDLSALSGFTWKAIGFQDSVISIINYTNTHFYINPCKPLFFDDNSLRNCSGSFVCSVENNITTSFGTERVIFEQKKNFFKLVFGSPDEKCKNDRTLPVRSIILMECGKNLGKPVLYMVTSCSVLFWWSTSLVCEKPPVRREVPCYAYDLKGDLRDLSPLIKSRGGYHVESLNPSSDFYINVCSDIDKVGETVNCPDATAACGKFGGKYVSFGKTMLAPSWEGQNLQLVYKVDDESLPGCDVKPQTTITFKCPPRGKGKLPRLVSDTNCHYQVEWETEYSCPINMLQGNKSTCNFNQNDHNVDIDLSPLTKSNGNYHLEADVNGTKVDFYLNVCGGLEKNFKCNDSTWRTTTVCVKYPETQTSHIIGRKHLSSLTYVDGDLSLIYHGNPFGSIIRFICSQEADGNGVGSPVFVELDNDVFVFDWKTKYACVKHESIKQCEINQGAVYVNLGILTRNGNEKPWQVFTGGAYDKGDTAVSELYLNVCGELPQSGSTKTCSDGTALCMIGSDGNVKNLGKFTSSPSYNSRFGIIQLNYTEGDVCVNGQQIRSLITMMCKPGDLDSVPVLIRVSDGGCLYEIEWQTAAACPLATKKGTDCKVFDNDLGLTFDLNPLRKVDYYKVPTDSYIYYINVCGPLKGTPCDKTTGKSQNAAACQVSVPESTSSTSWKLGEPNTEVAYKDGMINITYIGGQPYNNEKNTPRSTSIAFLCDPEAGEGHPQFVEETHHVYSFRWYTSYVCPMIRPVECLVEDPVTHKVYDLSRLTRVQGDSNWEVTESNNNETLKFYLNVCQQLVPTSRLCSPQAAVCVTKLNPKANKMEKMLIRDLGKPLSSPTWQSSGRLQLTYISGAMCVAYSENVNYSSKIHFLCPKNSMQEKLTFLGMVGNCEYSFLWITKAACPVEEQVVQEKCLIVDPVSGFSYDLSPLKRDGQYVVTSGSSTFYLNICGTISEEVCQIPEFRGKISVCEKFDKDNVTALGLLKHFTLHFSEENLLTMTFKGPYQKETGLETTVVITFHCRPNQTESMPRFVRREDYHTYIFDFDTPLVCETVVSDCTFTDSQGNHYDLSPLEKLDSTNWEVTDTRKDNKHLQYHINFCRQINRVSTYSCPGGPVGACMTDVQKPESVGISLGVIKMPPEVKNDQIILHYPNGSPCQNRTTQWSTVIILHCSIDKNELVFYGISSECQYTFSFETPAACPVKRERGKNCSVTDKSFGYHFDLSPLRKSGVYSVRGGEHTYLIKVCGNVDTDSKECQDAGVCQTKDSMIINAGKSNGNLTLQDGVLQLIYKGGKGNCHRQYERISIITFICDHSTDGIKEGPTFISEQSNCTYLFLWATSLACPPFEVEECSVSDRNGNQYDLSSLSLLSDNYFVTSPELPKKTFIMNVCRSVVYQPAARCPSEAAICLLDKENGKTLNLGRLVKSPHLKEGKLKLQYSEGDNCELNGTRKKYETVIEFRCDTKKYHWGKPEYVGQEGCTYYFTWSTSAACPLGTELLTFNCTTVNPLTGFRFDLSSLQKHEPYIVQSTANHEFQLNVCGDIKNSVCGRNIGSCQQEVLGDHRWDAGKANSLLHYREGILFLNYSGGSLCHDGNFRRSTIIQFVCGTSKGKPTFIFEDHDCTYFFTWHTPLACEHKVYCAVQNGTETIDLSPLILMEGKHTATNMMDDRSAYFLNLCRPLNPEPGVNCPPNAAVCKAGISDNKYFSLGQSLMEPIIDFEGHVTVLFHNGSQCESDLTQRNKARVIFLCDPTAGKGDPVLIDFLTEYCVYIFEWKTVLVCPGGLHGVSDSKKCMYSDSFKGLNFDLSPLSMSSSSYKTSGADEQEEFALNVCGAVRESDINLGCPGAGVCTLGSSGENFGVADSATLLYDGQVLKLQYTNGSDCPSGENGRRSSEIIFVCDPMAGINAPVLYKKYTCMAVFMWKTSLVCDMEEDECTLIAQGQSYNLRLLSSISHSWNTTDHSGNKYWLNVCHGLRELPKSVSCPPTAAVCRQTTEGQVESLGMVETQKLSLDDEGNLLLTYIEGSNTACEILGQHGSKQFASSHIKLKCGNTIGRPRLLSDTARDGCVFEFLWVTSVACREKVDLLIPENDGMIYDSRLDVRMDVSPQLSQTFEVRESRNHDEYIYYVNLNGGLKELDVACSQAAICQTNINKTFFRDVGSFLTREFILKGTELQLVLTSYGRKCGKNHKKNVTAIITFQCSTPAGIGSPEFVYESNNCDYLFNWETSSVCPQNFVSVADHGLKDEKGMVQINKLNTNKSVSSSTQIIVAVVLSAVLVAFIVFILAKEERRTAIGNRVKSAFRKINIPRLHYSRMAGSSRESDVVLLSHENVLHTYQDEDSDVDLLT